MECVYFDRALTDTEIAEVFLCGVDGTANGRDRDAEFSGATCNDISTCCSFTPPDPIFTWHFGATADDCTDVAHCSPGSSCSFSDDSDAVCNSTLSTPPDGSTYHMSTDCSGEVNLSGRNLIPTGHTEIWGKYFVLLDEDGISNPIVDFISVKAVDGAAPTQGAMSLRWWTASASNYKFRAISGDDTQSEADPAYVSDTWEEHKFHADTTLGLMEWWKAGSDFSGDATLTAEDSVPVEQDLRGLSIVFNTVCTKAYIDNIRLYATDPDA